MSEDNTTPAAETVVETAAPAEATTATPEKAAEQPTAPPAANPRGRNNNRGGRGGNPRGRGRRNDRRGKKREEKEFEEELLQIRRVTRVVKGGRRLRFSATVVIGDKKGRVGLGTDKATEVPQAIQKAIRIAKKNMITVPMVNGTIPHPVNHKFKAAKIMIMPGKSGSGVIAGGAMRKIAELAGIEDILGKSHGTNNKITNGRAMIEALASLRSAPVADKAEAKPAAEAVAETAA